MSEVVEAGTVVMIVDDDGQVRHSVSEILSTEGYEVLAVANAEAALAQLSQGIDPSVVIVDVWLTGSGLGSAELVGHLRSSRPDTRILVLSAWPPDRVELDVDAVLTKASEATTIVRAVDRLAGAHRIARYARRPAIRRAPRRKSSSAA